MFNFDTKFFFLVNKIGKIWQKNNNEKNISGLGSLSKVKQIDPIEGQFDQLTGLPNRHLLCNYLSHVIEKAKRDMKFIALIGSIASH